MTLAIDGNGFIAAFVAGAAFGAVADRQALDLEQTNELPELGGELLALIVWFLFGATLLPIASRPVERPCRALRSAQSHRRSDGPGRT